MSKNTTKAELEARLRDLTIKLRDQIAQNNRNFERAKLLEVENRELKAVLAEHGIDYIPRVNTLTIRSHKARFLQLVNDLGMANVRIRNGLIETRNQETREWAAA
jgi:hypothetical protein